jgi:hypothetical protein
VSAPRLAGNTAELVVLLAERRTVAAAAFVSESAFATNLLPALNQLLEHR